MNGQKDSYERLILKFQRLREDNDVLQKQLNQQSKLKRCQHCGVMATTEEANFCRMCGAKL